MNFADLDRPVRVLSLGAGVQSTTVALMSAFGDLPKLDVCVFSDTGWEPPAVYDHLERLVVELADHEIPMVRVTAGNLRQDHVEPQHERLFIRNPRTRPDLKGRQRTTIPVYLAGTARTQWVGDDTNPDDTELAGELRMFSGAGVTAVDDKPLGQYVTTHDGKGISRRTCTKTYKIEPVEKELRRMIGLVPHQRWPLTHTFDQWFGISWDEVQRMSDSTRPAIRHCYPLVDRRMTRDDCHAWMADHGWGRVT